LLSVVVPVFFFPVIFGIGIFGIFVSSTGRNHAISWWFSVVGYCAVVSGIVCGVGGYPLDLWRS